VSKAIHPAPFNTILKTTGVLQVFKSQLTPRIRAVLTRLVNSPNFMAQKAFTSYPETTSTINYYIITLISPLPRSVICLFAPGISTKILWLSSLCPAYFNLLNLRNNYEVLHYINFSILNLKPLSLFSNIAKLSELHVLAVVKMSTVLRLALSCIIVG
jgi:hypothetical protein